MCNIMAAVGGIALLAMMGGRGKKKSTEQPKPMLPRIRTDYSSDAQDQANINQGLADDASSGVATSSSITAGREASAGNTNYRNPLSIPQGGSSGLATLPTIGGVNKTKPVNY